MMHCSASAPTSCGRENTVWQYTAIDVASVYTWAALHVTPRNPSARWTSLLAQRVASDLAARGWRREAVCSDNGSEFRSAEFDRGRTPPVCSSSGHRAGKTLLTARHFNVTIGRVKLGAQTRPYHQVARARAQQRTRNALIAAAQSEFLAGRWEEVSLESIAAYAGVAKQTLLRHFGSKDGLFERAVEQGFNEVREQRFNAPIGDVAGAVDNLLEHYEQWGERAMRIGAVEGLGELSAEVVRRMRQLHYDWVEHAFGSSLGELGAKARRRRRAALIALCDVHTWWLLSHDLGLPIAEVRATLIDAIENMILKESKK